MGDRSGVPEEIAAALARGATILTGRQRAAHTLRQAFDLDQRARESAGWHPPKIFAWDAWTSGLWHCLLLDGVAERIVLNRTQERALWTSIIDEDVELSTLQTPASVATLAADAWSTLARYRGLDRLRQSPTTHDTQAFIRWAERFRQLCHERGYLTQSQLEDALRHAWTRTPGCLPDEKEFLLVGFDQLLPAQVALLDGLRDAGCLIRTKQTTAVAESRELLTAETEADEILAAAQWACKLLQVCPSSRVGVLVPGLKDEQALRTSIDRTFREVLAPEAVAITAPQRQVSYEFSTGSPLNRTELGKTLLALLDWTQTPMPVSQLSKLLISTCFAGGAERSARAAFDANVLRPLTLLWPEMSLDGAIERLRGAGKELSLLRASLLRMQVVVRRSFGSNDHRSYEDWAEAIRELLRAAGWGESAPDSAMFQMRKRWESVLDELVTLDFQGRRVRAAQAIETLRGIAETTTFAPESQGTPVQVMGPEEAAGIEFDAVWCMRAGETTLTGTIDGSPLLAWPLRRELGIPGANGAADGAHARHVMERIVGSCGEIVFSYARKIADGHQRQSALLNHLDLTKGCVEPKALETDVSIPVERVPEINRLPALPNNSLKGGAGILKAQAACAFHAFAEYRLFAGELKARDPGMNANERGRAVHKMLEVFWTEVGTQTKLQDMSIKDRRFSLTQAANASLAELRTSEMTSWEQSFLEAERRRLVRLGELWLEIEANRPLPFTVEAQETELSDVVVGPLRLKLRLDRVDSTDRGRLLIDYKTGTINSSVWHGERPDEPQLPLYAALTGQQELHGVAFGMVRLGSQMKLSGYADARETFGKSSIKIEMDSLADQMERWREVLERLAGDFADGDTRVLPKKYPDSCKHCAHRLICRLDLSSPDIEDEEDGVDDAREELG